MDFNTEDLQFILEVIKPVHFPAGEQPEGFVAIFYNENVANKIDIFVAKTFAECMSWGKTTQSNLEQLSNGSVQHPFLILPLSRLGSKNISGDFSKGFEIPEHILNQIVNFSTISPGKFFQAVSFDPLTGKYTILSEKVFKKINPASVVANAYDVKDEKNTSFSNLDKIIVIDNQV